MSSSPYKRIAADAALFLSVLFAPWWAALVLCAAFAFIFSWYYEGAVAGFLVDALYGVPHPALADIRFAATAVAALIVAASLYARVLLRYYHQ